MIGGSFGIGENDMRNIYGIDWEAICLLTKEDGLGVRNIDEAHTLL